MAETKKTDVAAPTAESAVLDSLKAKEKALQEKLDSLSKMDGRLQNAQGHDLLAAKLRTEAQLDEVRAAIRKGGK